MRNRFSNKHGDKIAQFMFKSIKTPAVLELDRLENTDRGNKGFGSTGVKTSSDSVNAVTKSSSMLESVAKLNTYQDDAVQDPIKIR